MLRFGSETGGLPLWSNNTAEFKIKIWPSTLKPCKQSWPQLLSNSKIICKRSPLKVYFCKYCTFRLKSLQTWITNKLQRCCLSRSILVLIRCNSVRVSHCSSPITKINIVVVESSIWYTYVAYCVASATSQQTSPDAPSLKIDLSGIMVAFDGLSDWRCIIIGREYQPEMGLSVHALRKLTWAFTVIVRSHTPLHLAAYIRSE